MKILIIMLAFATPILADSYYSTRPDNSAYQLRQLDLMQEQRSNELRQQEYLYQQQQRQRLQEMRDSARCTFNCDQGKYEYKY
jgi:hypothetical protein